MHTGTLAAHKFHFRATCQRVQCANFEGLTQISDFDLTHYLLVVLQSVTMIEMKYTPSYLITLIISISIPIVFLLTIYYTKELACSSSGPISQYALCQFSS
jgi:hypothetical protein